MRYSQQHKQQTRQRVIAAAARAFRAQGVANVSIPTLMKQVGLTHGGFYAHFESKDALVAEACASGQGETVKQLFRAAEQADPGKKLQAILDTYLTPAHRDNPASGCTIPALAAEIAREPAEVRHAFTQSIRALLARLKPLMPDCGIDATDEPTNEPTDETLALLSGMAGAVLLARAVDDPALSDRILDAAHTFYSRAFTSAPTTR
ncbi:MAG TPA: TetR/AcrR family transcriptional regulator [Ktedonobacterales bacterium]